MRSDVSLTGRANRLAVDLSGAAARVTGASAGLSRRWVAIGGAVAVLSAAHAYALTLPPDQASPWVLASHGYALALLVGLLWLGAAVGLRVSSALGLRDPLGLERLLFALALGLGPLAYVALACGLLGLLQPWLLAALMALIAIALRRELGELLNAMPAVGCALLATRREISRDPILRLTAPLVGVLLALLLLMALAPPHGYDALMYHLQGPRRFLELGRLTVLPDVQQANMPFTIDFLYLLSMAFGSDEMPSLLHLTFAVSVALAILSFGQQFLDKRIGWIGGVTFVSTTLMSVYAPVANIDFGLALFDFLAVYAFAHWLRDREAHWLVVAGTLVGFSMGSKYLGVITGGVLGIWIIVDAARTRRGALDTVRLVVRYAAPAAVISAPWYVKNMLWFGSPVWPLLATGPADFGMYLLAHADLGRGLLDYLLLPLRLYTVGSVEYPEARPPLLLLALPLYAVMPKQRAITLLLAFASCYVVAWSQSGQALRYLTPVLPELCLGAAYTVEALGKRMGRGDVGQRAISVLVVAGLVLPVALTGLFAFVQQPLRQLVGLESRESYLMRTVSNHRLVTYLNNQGEAVRGVLLLGDRRGYYLERPVWEDVNFGAFEALASAPDPAAAREYLAQAGVSHVIVSDGDLNWLSQFDPDGQIQRWRERFRATSPGYLAVEQTDEARLMTLYRVIESPGPVAAEATAPGPGDRLP